MKLKIFDQTNLPVSTLRSGRPAIHISRGGTFTINQYAIALLGLDSTAMVKLAQDETEAQDWYIFKCPEGNGYTVRPKSKKDDGTKSFIFSNSSLAHLILDSLKIDKSVSLPLAKLPENFEDKKVFALLTKAVAKR